MENSDPTQERSIPNQSPAGAAGARENTAPTASNAQITTPRASRNQDNSHAATTANPPPPRRGTAGRRYSQRRIRSNSNMHSGLHTNSLSMSDPHHESLTRLREFLKTRSAFDVFPLSYRFIIFDTKLTVKYALATMHQNGIVYAPLFDSKNWQYAGMLTLLNIIHLIQYYYMKAETFETAAADVETFKIESLRDIEKELNVPPPPLHSIHPSKPLYEACKLLIQSHAHRLPLIDYDTESNMELIASVLTLFRVLRFISLNCSKDIQNLSYSLRSLGIGTYVDPKPDNPYYPIITATMDSTVFDVVNMFSTHGISAVPILNDDGVVLNVYETLDVTTLIRSGAYTKLDLSIRQAIQQRTAEFLGVVTCSGNDTLGKLLELISRQQLHRLVVVDADGRLAGIITLGDILSYIVKDGKDYHPPGTVTPTTTSLPTAVESPKEVDD